MAQFALSKGQDWRLVNPQQDIRGWPAKTEDDDKVGEVRDLIIDSDTNRVEAVELNNGETWPARDVGIGRGEVYLQAEGGVSDGYDQTRARSGSPSFEHYESSFRTYHEEHHEDKEVPYQRMLPAYRHGYDYAVHKEHRDRNYGDLESEMRSNYNERHGGGAFDRASRAIRHSFEHVRSKGLGGGGRRKDINRRV